MKHSKKFSSTHLLKGLFSLVIVLFLNTVSLAQTIEISGTVRDEDNGEGLPGATVMEKGTTNGTVTDMNGAYRLNVKEGATLVVSFVGFETIEIPTNNRSVVDISLLSDLSELEEVVVIGYGTQKKKVATGSISKVDAKNLEGYNVADVKSALDGQVSGLMVSPSSGQPGSSSNILIRGVSTNGDNSPLFVVDGMTVDNIDNINPSDIESIDILKDAASTAIYGARAANGVVIVTTKKGSDGKGVITYEGFTSYSNPWKTPEMLNADQYIQLTREKFANAGQTTNLENRNFPQLGDDTPDTDWMDVIFDQATQVKHQLSASLENTYLSLEYWDQNGVIGGEKSNYKRYALRVNSKKALNDYFTINQNLYINRTENQNLSTNDAFGTMIADAFAYDPITEVYDENAQYGFAQSEWVQKEYINPLSRLFLADNEGHADQVLGNVSLTFQPMEGLSFKSDLGVDYNWYNYRSFTPDYDFHDAFQNPNNSVSEGYGHNQRVQFENYLNYTKTFGVHSVNLVAGTSYITQNFQSSGGSTLNIPDAAKFNDDFQYIDAGQDTSELAFGYANVDYRLVSIYGRILYDYESKYLFSATIRRDGSSRFGANNRFGIFPSFSLGWVISDESFFSAIEPVSFLKLRSSWGVNGSDRIGDLAYASRVVNAYSYALGRDPAINRGSALPTVPNPNLKWEESVQFDIGMELNFLDDRLATEFDYYRKTTRDLLGPENVPGYLGVSEQPLSNLGEIRNTGIEAMISYRQSIGDFKFNTTLNYTSFKNTTVEVPGTTEFITGWAWPVRNLPITRLSEGLPVAHFVGYKTEGIFRSQQDLDAHLNSNGQYLQSNAEVGDLIFSDVNDDGVINSDDITNIGSPWPDHILGLNLSGNYKGFDFGVLFSTQIGHDIYRTYERSDVPFSNYQTFWLDRYSENNVNGDYPRLVSTDPNGNQRPSDFYVEDGSFLRLRNIQVGYNLPSRVCEAVKLSSVRIYLSANNLWTLTGYKGFDPEIGTNNDWILDTGIDKGYYPTNKTIGAGIKISM